MGWLHCSCPFMIIDIPHYVSIVCAQILPFGKWGMGLKINLTLLHNDVMNYFQYWTAQTWRQESGEANSCLEFAA